MNRIWLTLVGAVSLCVLDALWLKFFMKAFCEREFGALLRMHNGTLSPVVSAVVTAYMIMIIGFVVFVGPYIAQAKTVLSAGFFGAIFGCVVFGLYDLTNYAILASWPLSMVMIDVAWGTFLYAITSMIAYTLLRS